MILLLTFCIDLTFLCDLILAEDPIHFIYGPAHSPPALPVYTQIIILHVIAIVIALFFYFLRRYVVERLSTKSVAGPPRRYTARRNHKSPINNSKNKQSSSSKTSVQAAPQAQSVPSAKMVKQTSTKR
ncbi:hypothetical protein RDWZM_000380 [Blomia tropicalis]|uniref:Uncharacterized protein n=1 Tax=Blomia tropicalis TaxID=40697 RepID=A0A9Q0M9R6_BLOTA|nr:hypothetical protein BLOT_013930 [Blomia tropicalis]KAJ6221835.1 hypothetical protein RDWZM_000380 [Blomia tropicalis]